MLRVVYDDVSDLPGYRELGQPARFGPGFHGEEVEEAQAFRWMGEEGRLDFVPPDGGDGGDGGDGDDGDEAEARFLELEVFSPFFDLTQTLAFELPEGGELASVVPLVHGWAPVSVAVPAGATGATLRVSKLLPAAHHPADPRALGVRVRRPHLHGDAARHAVIERQQSNAVLNLDEMLAGKTELRSTPPVLGIDLHGVCNVKPPCVYCEWDGSKALEGDAVDTPFTRQTVEEWGPFFDHSVSLVNCSIGEPFMMKDTLDDLLDAFGEQGKTLEMTTNGQILTDKNIEKLLGRKIHLYISLDAGTADTYAKLRNDKFDRILGNLRRLIAAKGGRAGLPKVHLVFMPMRVNVHELEDFVRLCADLGVDRMVLRPLNYSESSGLDWERNGHHFVYGEELLPWDELVRVSGRAAELARRFDVPLADQLGFGGGLAEQFPEEFERGRREATGEAAAAAEVEEPEPQAAEATEPSADAVPAGAPDDVPEARPDALPDGGPDAGPLPSLGEDRLPLCIEPWKSLYILRRGVLPCCYGAAPLAPMEEYRETWNSPTLQAIRRDLAAGRFHDYCLSSESCPIVRKAAHQKGLGGSERTVITAEAVWHKIDRLGFGVPGRLMRPFKRPLRAVARRVGALLSS